MNGTHPQPVFDGLGRPIHAVMEHAQVRNLKRRAEAMAR
jgi:hypothetical protein